MSRDADRDSSVAAREREGTRTPEKHERPVQRPRRSRWSYLPLTRTRHKLLTGIFIIPWLSITQRVPPRLSAKRPGSLRDRAGERDIAKLITAYREGATAASLAAAHGLSLKSAKRLLHIAGVCRTSPPRQATKATPAATHP
jgi:hypothetical protein